MKKRSVFRKEDGWVCPNEIFTIAHDLALLFFSETICPLIVNRLATICPLAMCDLKQMQDQPITSMSGMFPQIPVGDISLPHRAKERADAALKEVVVANLIVHVCKLAVDRVWMTE